MVVLLLIFAGRPSFATDKKAIDFSLENFDGQTVTSESLKGKVIVLTFSFAFCSVRCPIISARLLSLDNLLNAYQDVVYLHVSVDPDMDSAEKRRQYFKLYGIDTVKDKRWMFVSGRKKELSKLWKFYGIDIEKVESKEIPEGYYMEYTPKVVIIGKNGNVKYETDFYFAEEKIANKIMDAR
jgi:protein SCO1/2